MSISLDSSNTALLVIDVQIGLFSKATPIYKAEELLGNINTLSKQFSQSGNPVFFIQHSNQNLLLKGSENWQHHPGLNIKQRDIFIHKTHGNAFEGTTLKHELDSRSIECLLVTGFVTNGCVKATCIGARDLGYRVVLVEDGHSTYVKGASRVINEWNHKLGDGVVDLYPTAAIWIDK
jgi:nicotinamidase-related amidase